MPPPEQPRRHREFGDRTIIRQRQLLEAVTIGGHKFANLYPQETIALKALSAWHRDHVPLPASLLTTIISPTFPEALANERRIAIIENIRKRMKGTGWDIQPVIGENGSEFYTLKDPKDVPPLPLPDLIPLKQPVILYLSSPRVVTQQFPAGNRLDIQAALRMVHQQEKVRSKKKEKDEVKEIVLVIDGKTIELSTNFKNVQLLEVVSDADKNGNLVSSDELQKIVDPDDEYKPDYYRYRLQDVNKNLNLHNLAISTAKAGKPWYGFIRGKKALDWQKEFIKTLDAAETEQGGLPYIKGGIDKFKPTEEQVAQILQAAADHTRGHNAESLDIELFSRITEIPPEGIRRLMFIGSSFPGSYRQFVSYLEQFTRQQMFICLKKAHNQFVTGKSYQALWKEKSLPLAS